MAKRQRRKGSSRKTYWKAFAETVETQGAVDMFRVLSAGRTVTAITVDGVDPERVVDEGDTLLMMLVNVVPIGGIGTNTVGVAYFEGAGSGVSLGFATTDRYLAQGMILGSGMVGKFDAYGFPWTTRLKSKRKLEDDARIQFFNIPQGGNCELRVNVRALFLKG